MTEGMRFKDHSVTPILVGLHRVGLVGLADALKVAEASGLEDRERLVDLLVAELKADNYVPDSQAEAFRIAVWREYLRHRGLDFGAFLSAVEVSVRGAAGADRDRLVELLWPALAEHDLRPVLTFEEATAEGPGPQLVIRGEVVSRGLPSPGRLREVIRTTLSDW